MTQTADTDSEDIARLRAMAEELGSWCEADFLLLTGYTPVTLEQYRKRGVVEYIRVGCRRFYPKGPAIARFQAGSKAGPRVAAREVL